VVEITTLVTGATGRIGRHLVNALISKGEKVRVLIRDRMTEFENVETFYGDLIDKEAVKKAVEGIDTIFHLAAVVDYSASDDQMYQVNVEGTKNILEVFKGNKLIYLSSTAVLGKKLKSPADESTPYSPSNFYGKTKMEAEKFVKANNGIVVRSPDVLMPRFTEGYDMIFSKLMEGRMPIIGDGKNFIDYIYITDLIQALLLAMEKGKKGEIYMVSGKGVKTQKECLEIASKFLNVEPPKKHVSAFSALLSSKIRRKKDFTPEYVEKILRNRTYDITKAKNELGFDPKIDLETAIKLMVENYLGRLNQEKEEVSKEQSEQQS
jgi:nucleoside-diphosphate-sugar epimerase